jgi:hypothetical protein
MLYPQRLNLAPDFMATNTREPSDRSENDYRKLAQFFPLAFAHLSWYIVVKHTFRAMSRVGMVDSTTQGIVLLGKMWRHVTFGNFYWEFDCVHSYGVFTWAFLTAPKNRWSYFSPKSVPVGAKVAPKILERPVAPFHRDGIRSNLERKSQSGLFFRLRSLGPESRSKSRFDIFCRK